MAVLTALFATLALPVSVGVASVTDAVISPEMHATKASPAIVGLAEPLPTAHSQSIPSGPLAAVRAAEAAFAVRRWALAERGAPFERAPARLPRFLMTSPARAGPALLR